MITFTKSKLIATPELYQTFAEIAEEAVAKPRDECLAELQRYALRGVDCTVVYDGDELIGYILHGPIEKFLLIVKHIPLVLKLRSIGVVNPQTACHVHLRRAYWKTGTQLQMSREMAKSMLADGTSHLLLYGYATDQLAEYSLSQPGSVALPGMLDYNGRQVGLRDLAVYLEGTA